MTRATRVSQQAVTRPSQVPDISARYLRSETPRIDTLMIQLPLLRPPRTRPAAVQTTRARARARFGRLGLRLMVVASSLLSAGAADAAVRIVRRPAIIVTTPEPTTTSTSVATGPTTSTTVTVVPPAAAVIVFDPKDPRCRGKLATRALLDRAMAKASTQLLRADTRVRRAENEGRTNALAALTAELDDAEAKVNTIQTEIDILVQRCR